MGMFDTLEAIEQRYRELEEEMARPEMSGEYERLSRLAKARASLQELVSMYRDYKQTLRSLEEAREMLGDPELEGLAREEVGQLEARQEELEGGIRLALLHRDPNDERDVIVEIRAGTGGDEAALFAADLFRLYSRYAEIRGWGIDVIDANAIGIGGFKEIIFEVKGKGAFSRLKHERGVHRVQRVPVTEASGRIHTSTVTVAVLPEAEEVEVDIGPDDLRVDIFHAGGHGGQNVNKVASAVRITHLPSGLVVACQDERSQIRNRQKAMAVLRARLLDREMRRQQEETSAERRSQVGTGERAEKIRTYNFPQNRVTDHRINLTLHSLDRVLEGELDGIVDALIAEEQARQLQEAVV